MHGTCPVVTIETENGPVDINKSDFDSKTMKLYEAETVENETADDLFAKSIANINGMNKEALVVALDAMEADIEGKVPELKERLRTVMTEADNNGESE